MDFSNFSIALNWIIAHGYSLLFLVTLIEGPTITAAGAFAAKLGYFNIYIIFLISILGNLIPDIVYYAIGYWGRLKLVDKYGKYFKLSQGRISRIEQLMEKHASKILLVVKLLPFLAVPGLMIAGASRMTLKKYIYLSTLIILPSSFAFLLIGYYAGTTYNKLSGYTNSAGYLIAAAIAIFFIISFIWKKIASRLANKIEQL